MAISEGLKRDMEKAHQAVTGPAEVWAAMWPSRKTEVASYRGPVQAVDSPASRRPARSHHGVWPTRTTWRPLPLTNAFRPRLPKSRWHR